MLLVKVSLALGAIGAIGGRVILGRPPTILESMVSSVLLPICILIWIFRWIFRDESAAQPADTRKLPKRTDTAVIVHDITPRVSQKPRRKLKWQKMLDAATDARQLAEHTETLKTGKRVRHQTTR